MNRILEISFYEEKEAINNKSWTDGDAIFSIYTNDEGETTTSGGTQYQAAVGGWGSIGDSKGAFVRGRGYYITTVESGWFKVTADGAIFVWEVT